MGPWDALTAIGTLALAVSAAGIALWQHIAQESVRRGEREEKATLVAIIERTKDSVTIRNLGSTPISRLVVGETCTVVDRTAAGGVSWGEFTGIAVARVDPHSVELLAPDETRKLSFLEWKNDADGSPIAAENLLEPPDVTYSYRDAAGARWERKNHDLPYWGGGRSLPGEVMARRRLALRWKVRHRKAKLRKHLRARSRG
ncbi:hypothetical protein [Streptomyces chiangmaiensis]|uniref:Uncharacterized protein n=1 Tax=Streptomyces chiangmaiensis TaxID=766497 RepID=A0ABU7FGJ9_9ACTN|nr:hypothetical protein [Streptomyces chiangmaiensis]MED7823214.1 hypothetical protein [Streptomyces chiangmaiensis]